MKKKTYTEPEFKRIKTDEANKVFFAASGGGGGATLPGVGKTPGEW